MYASKFEREPLRQGLAIVDTCSFSEVERNLRKVALKDKVIPGFRPYRQSLITLEELPLDGLQPCALYVLKPNLERIGAVRKALLDRGIDIFKLKQDKAHIGYDYGPEGYFALSSPIVEVSEDDGGVAIIVDGLHRVVTARNQGLASMVVIKIENPAIPLPALPVSWNEVRVCDETPSTEQKRRFRFSSMAEIRRWVACNYDRYIRGFDFPELEWEKRGQVEEGIWADELEALRREKSAAAVVTNGNGKILLIQRAGEGEGLWGLPAGGQERADFGLSSGRPLSFSSTMRRELREETGLIALRWRLMTTIMTAGYHFGSVWEAQVADGQHVDMDLEEYVSAFNQRADGFEVARLGLFTLPEIKRMARDGLLFKPEYNLRAAEVYFEQRDNPPVIPTHYAPWDAPDMFWHNQVGIWPFPIQQERGYLDWKATLEASFQR